MPNPLTLYHQLPYPLRVLVASARGYYLKWWRYGAKTDRLVEEALEREQWSAQQWQTWQEERLPRLLHRAATEVPYYRAYWQKRRRAGDQASWELLGNWPVLRKEPLRQNPLAFVADDCNPKRMYNIHTSGTSGKPLNLWFSRKAIQTWFALFEARWHRWYGVSRHDRWAILGGQLVAPVSQTEPPYWVWNQALHQLYMSSYHISPDSIYDYLEAMHRHKIVYMLGYASSMFSLAQTILKQDLHPPSLSVAISNAEPLYNYQRAAIQKAFGCPVRNTYGLSEYVCAAGECAEDILHLWPEVGVTEIFHDDVDGPIRAGEVGRIICTGLLNPDMPLIRYEVGDRGSLVPDSEVCTCGRTLPRIQQIEGRIDDVIITPDGRRIGRLDPVFKVDLPIREAQIIQEDLTHLSVKIVPTTDYTPLHGEEIRRLIQDRVGPMDIVVTVVDEIPRSANGKFRAVMSLIDRADR